MEKYRRAGQATDNLIWRMRIAWWITKATNTHSQYLITYCFSTATMVARTPMLRYAYSALFTRSPILTLFVPTLSLIGDPLSGIGCGSPNHERF